MAALATTASAHTHPEGADNFRFFGHHDNQSGKENVSQAKKTEFFRIAENLRKQVDKLEKEKALGNQSRNLFRDDSGTLEEYDNKLKLDHKTEVIKLQQHLRKIHNGVNRFQRQLMDVKPTPELIEKLKEIMTEVENSITTFKDEQRQSYEELMKKENTCWQEGPDGEMPPEVTELERFLLLTGGRQGGWDQCDHESFLRARAKLSGKPAHKNEALLHVPGKRKDEVLQHEEWYERLLFLEEKKREAIQRWKTQRQQKREAELRQQEEKEDTARQEEVELVEAQQRRAEEERREAAARLEAWKAELRVQEAEEEGKRVREEVFQRRKAKEERRRQLEVKLALEAHNHARNQEKELLLQKKKFQEQEEKEERERSAARGIRIFQERDLFVLETKLLEKQAKEDEEMERQKRLAKLKEKVEVHIHRDAARLCKPTKGWEERTKVIGPTSGGPVSQMFHRAVPSWRQDL
ncbi:hypothetical protein AAFF_G00379380 [Aldrovandia affinis]|uniref:Coiled-coil domain-containing protein 112 n=1 Tax=Aldrovandia affinis TaxID=143900 RepID=A0AAD7WLN8_9TELE|nr:hypothetical protein AAFF_G00379380 [Aldrovandia affinis]